MTNTAENNKRIAKNTLLLYFRMLLTMVISLYTSRIILKAIGIEDYGIYNVVGGVIASLGFLHTTLAAASQRFITFSLGSKNPQEVKSTFSNCLAIHTILVIIIIIIAETIGIYFLNTQLNIPAARLYAANIVFQCALGVFCMLILSVPYEALIIAHERMNAFAYISIIEVSLKLFSVYILLFISFDRLIIYAILWLLISIIIRLIYSTYCVKHFKESNTKPQIHKKRFKEILNFSSYNLIEIFANMLADQGLNIFLNILFGPAVNAARGIAVQVNGALNGFTNNFSIALNPQIIKTYAEKDFQRMNQLISNGSKYSFYLLLIIGLPIFFKIDYILKLWLETVPDYCAEFIQLLIIINLIAILTRTFYTAVSATGNIKHYQITLGIFRLLILPIAYILLHYIWKDPIVVYFLLLFFEIIAIAFKLYLIKKLIIFSIKYYLIHIIGICCLTGIISLFFSGLISNFYENNFISLIIFSINSICITVGVIFIIGLQKDERKYLLQNIKNKFSKLSI